MQNYFTFKNFEIIVSKVKGKIFNKIENIRQKNVT